MPLMISPSTSCSTLNGATNQLVGKRHHGDQRYGNDSNVSGRPILATITTNRIAEAREFQRKETNAAGRYPRARQRAHLVAPFCLTAPPFGGQW
jgi:hypothetical protein